jgi:hypothetical protein
MAIDLIALDEKIRKLQLIRSLASDPELARLLQDVVSSNGSGTHAAASPPQKPLGERKGQRYEVLKYVADASEIGDYRTATQITQRMEEAKFKFNSHDHPTTVRDCLRELEKEGLVERSGTTAEGATLWRRRP